MFMQHCVIQAGPSVQLGPAFLVSTSLAQLCPVLHDDAMHAPKRKSHNTGENFSLHAEACCLGSTSWLHGCAGETISSAAIPKAGKVVQPVRARRFSHFPIWF